MQATSGVKPAPVIGSAEEISLMEVNELESTILQQVSEKCHGARNRTPAALVDSLTGVKYTPEGVCVNWMLTLNGY